VKLKGWHFFAGGLGAAGLGVLTWYLLYRRQQMEVDVTDPKTKLPGNPKGARVQFRERASGVVPPLQAFLDWWEQQGPFPVLVAPDGGLRFDEAKQRKYYEQGLSKAATLADTPHGRGAALDLWPVGFQPAKKLDEQPDIKKKFTEMGRIAKTQFNLTWGGDWGWDYPHVEVKNWRKLYPYPPTQSFLAGLNLK
jgi:hypothetical protein